jgi:uncharacterized membrane protein
MINVFMKSPLPNTLAVLTLLALLIAWISSVVLSLRGVPVGTRGGWFAILLPLFSLLGIPAAIDLFQAGGLTTLYAAIAFVVFVANIVVPILRMRGAPAHPLVKDWYRWSILFAALAGIAVAGYLTLVDVAGSQVSCGPSGGCQTVQQSKYAVLFGVLPVATLGLIGYVAILASWIAWQFGPAGVKRMAPLAIWGMCVFGALFSIYLTTLEPFVIGATCMWCISSAVLMAILLLVSTPFAAEALRIPDDDEPELAADE